MPWRFSVVDRPCLWPAAPDLENRAVGLGFERGKTALDIGSTWIVSVAASSKEASFWRLVPAPAADLRAGFVRSAAASLEQARLVALRDLPMTTRIEEARRHRSWSAEPIVVEGQACDHVLDGRSFGLAMCLAHASVALGLAVPPNVLAIAEVARDGALVPVDRL
jgi:hypothetical protein